MSMANFGSFLGGIAQGQQSAEAQKERAAYLLMLQNRQRTADQDKSDTQEAQFENAFASGTDTPTANDPFGGELAPGGGPGPMPPRGPQPPQPGQPSMPQQAMMPGAQPMPGAPGGQPQPQMRPPVNGNAGPQNAPPQPARPAPPGPVGGMPPQGQGQPPAGGPGMPPPGGQPPQAPKAPQTVDEMFAAAQKALDDTEAQLKTPIMERIAKDPQVQKDEKAYHDYVKELQAAGISPGGQRPSSIQQKRLMLLHDQLGLSSAAAAKHLGADDKAQMAFGKQRADLFAKQAAAKNVMQRVTEQDASHERVAETRASARAGAGGGGTADPDDVNMLVRYFKANNTFPKYTSAKDPAVKAARKQLGMDPDAVGDASANKTMTTGDTRAYSNLDTRKRLVDDVSGVMESLEPAIMASAAKVAKLTGMGPSATLNHVMQAGQTKFAGNGDVQELVTKLQGYKSAYARLISQNTGAGGSTVESLKMSKELADGSMPVSQLAGTFRGTKAEREATKSNLDRVMKQTASDVAARGKDKPKGGDQYSGHTLTQADFDQQYRSALSQGYKGSEGDFKKVIEDAGSKVGN